MGAEVKWDTEPELGKCLAKTGTLRIGGKTINFPNRATSVSKTRSEYALVHDATKAQMPLNTIATYHTQLDSAGLDNITNTNGKFGARKHETEDAISHIGSGPIRIVYLRIPKGDTTIGRISKDQAVALFDFLNAVSNNDALLIPVPSRINNIDMMKPIIDGWEERKNTIGTKKPIVGYIPSVDNPLLARKILEQYLESELDINVFAVDFASGHAERTKAEIISTLLEARKSGKVQDFYIHGFNIRHFYDMKNVSVAVEDMYSHIIGFDSFNNVLYTKGGPDIRPGTRDERVQIKKLRYWHEGDYGGHHFDEAISRAEQSTCHCPACKDYSVEQIYEGFGYDRSSALLKTHHIYSELVNEKKQKEFIADGELDKYLYGKEFPTKRGLVREIQRHIRGINI